MAKREIDQYLSYFKDEESLLLFTLLYLDGDTRAKILGIKEELYDSERKAKRWRNKLIKKIHPDYCSHPGANEATAKLTSIFKRMIAHGE